MNLPTTKVIKRPLSCKRYIYSVVDSEDNISLVKTSTIALFIYEHSGHAFKNMLQFLFERKWSNRLSWEVAATKCSPSNSDLTHFHLPEQLILHSHFSSTWHEAAICRKNAPCETKKPQSFSQPNLEGGSKVCHLHSDWPNVCSSCNTDLLTYSTRAEIPPTLAFPNWFVEYWCEIFVDAYFWCWSSITEQSTDSWFTCYWRPLIRQFKTTKLSNLW